jgi:hypothetical protein
MRPETLDRLQEARRLDRGGEPGRALLAYKLVLRMEPECVDARIDLAGLLMTLSRFEEALALCEEALQARPGSLAALQNKVGALLGLERFQEAEGHCRRILEQDPTWAPAHLGLALEALLQGRLEEAEASLLTAQSLDPSNRKILSALFATQVKLRAWDRLRPTWMALADQDLDPAKGTMEKAFIHLSYGDLEKGWECYEARLDSPSPNELVLKVPQPVWDGSPFPGRALLLHYEQGMGDTFMFIRYAQLAKARGGTVHALVQPKVLEALRGCPGIDSLFTLESPCPAFDLHLPLLSLPRVLGTRLDSIPAPVPYLKVPEAPSPAEAAVVPSPQLKVGLVWAGSTGHTLDFMRTLPVGDLAPLAEIPGVDWYSLQVGFQGGLPWEGLPDLSPSLKTFADTARVLSRLDLLITVDTSVAHLAGGLGLPVWLLLPILPDWRWLLEGDRTAWYPTFRLFRQRTHEDWSTVMAEVGDSLKALMNARRGTC